MSMVDKKVHYIFHRYKNFGESPDIVVSELHHEHDALFEFIYQTLGYAIIEVTTEKETLIQAKEV